MQTSLTLIFFLALIPGLAVGWLLQRAAESRVHLLQSLLTEERVKNTELLSLLIGREGLVREQATAVKIDAPDDPEKRLYAAMAADNAEAMDAMVRRGARKLKDETPTLTDAEAYDLAKEMVLGAMGGQLASPFGPRI